jgi:diguanylate cyclase (GGDEF)-like protein
MFSKVLRRSGCDTLTVLSAVLRSLASTVAHGKPDPNAERVLEQLKTHTDALAAASHCHDSFEPDAIAATCAEAFGTLERRQRARQHEMAAFLVAVREAIASLTFQEESSTATTAHVLDRLARVQQTDNIDDLKRLVADVAESMRRTRGDEDRQQKAVVSGLMQRLTLAEEQLSLTANEAFIDPVTRATNRQGFDLALEKRIKELDPATPLVLAIFDVDSLKSVNQAIGQAAGDAILRHVAGTLRQAVRPHDVVARIGGDEFAVIASGLTLIRAQGRMRQMIEAIRDGRVAPSSEPVSVCCGAAEFSAGDSMPTLLHRADAALRDAKTQGKGSVVIRTAPSIRSMLRPAKFGRTA